MKHSDKHLAAGPFGMYDIDFYRTDDSFKPPCVAKISETIGEAGQVIYVQDTRMWRVADGRIAGNASMKDKHAAMQWLADMVTVIYGA